MSPIEIPEIDPKTLVDKRIREVTSEALGLKIRYGPLTMLERIEAESHPVPEEKALWMCWKMFNKAYPDTTYEDFVSFDNEKLSEILLTLLESQDFRVTMSGKRLHSPKRTKKSDSSAKPSDTQSNTS